MKTRETLVAQIKANLPFQLGANDVIQEDAILADLGIDSLHLITMILVLQREYSLDISRMTEDGMPRTVGDLVTLVEQSGVGETELSQIESHNKQ